MNHGTVCKSDVRGALLKKMPDLLQEFAADFAAVGVSGRKILDVFDGITATAQAAGKRTAVDAVVQYVMALGCPGYDAAELAISRHRDEKTQNPEIRLRAMRVLAPEALKPETVPLMVRVQLKCQCGSDAAVVCVPESEVKARLAEGSLCPECAAIEFKKIRLDLGWEKPESEGDK